MNYTIEILSKAKIELVRDWEWYEEKQTGLGVKFKQQIYNALKIIEQYPEQFPEKIRNYQEAPVKIFPYLIIYRISKRKKVISIVSIFHTRRHPKKKLKA
jgi:mRNA-degrading endonuclease RelE of RelBE toxin-antitoxin system